MLEKIFKQIILLLFFLYGCGGDNPTRFNQYRDLIPLQKGNQWRYTVHSIDFTDSTRSVDTTYTIEISEELQIDNDSEKIVVYIWDSSDDTRFKSIAGNTKDGFCFYGTISDVDTFLLKTLFLKYPVNVGETWNYFTPSTNLEGEISLGDTLIVECLSLSENLETPSGNYSSVLYHFRKNTSPEFTLDFYWYVKPDLGPVGITIKRRHKDFDQPLGVYTFLLSNYQIQLE